MSRDTGSKTPAESTLSSIHCSNCGGPLASSLDVNCTFCGSRINDGSEWLLEKIIKEFDQEYLTVVHPNLNKPDATKQPTPLGQKPQNELIMISAQVLMADGRIDDSEMKLLQTIAQKHNVSDAELNEIIENIRQGLVFVPVPAGGTVASLGLIRDAAKMAAADGEISPDEIEAIMNLGYQLGYTKFDVKTIINKELTILKNKS
ncbi:MAG: Dna-J like membrane chaperone protein [bacterium ADurb.Bin157]|nr:MAG: Dna-J like membrane chaperone protein [bacterium ADurb.Bin157]